MIWTRLDGAAALRQWLRSSAAGGPPSAYEVQSPEETRARVEPFAAEVEHVGAEATILPSGLLQCRFDVAEGRRELFQKTEIILDEFARGLDPDRTWLQANEAHADEDFAAHVHHDLLTRIDEVDVIGPGGRLIKQLVGSTAIFDLSVHPRRLSTPIQTEWRSAEDIGARVIRGLAERPRATLRAAFGYYEPSAFEPASVIRSAFVFVLEHDDCTLPPRWRTAVVEAATHSEDLPPEAGMDSVTSACI